jgi:hypothetical protein
MSPILRDPISTWKRGPGVVMSVGDCAFRYCSPVATDGHKIVGYIHVCQTGQWQRSLTMLMTSIKSSGLYDATAVIRLGIVNTVGHVIPDAVLEDPKFTIVYHGSAYFYERPTLLHMKKMSDLDPETTVYYYLHTKGLRHFGTRTEQAVVDWINLMLYWNIECWQMALEKLHTFDTYGCNDIGFHYSGNFWWATCKHIRYLPATIQAYYIAPENWIQTKRDRKFSAFNSPFMKNGMHYSNLFPQARYVK